LAAIIGTERRLVKPGAQFGFMPLTVRPFALRQAQDERKPRPFALSLSKRLGSNWEPAVNSGPVNQRHPRQNGGDAALSPAPHFV